MGTYRVQLVEIIRVTKVPDPPKPSDGGWVIAVVVIIFLLLAAGN